MQRLFYNGDIITMEEKNCEAVLIENGIIKKAGNYEELKKTADKDCRITDLKGGCLMPSFIDAHSHFLQFANTLRFVPLKDAKSIKEVQEKLCSYIKEKNIEEGQWVLGFGYDHNSFAEKRHPNCHELDAVSCKHPIVIANASFHMGVMNSAGLKLYGLNDSVKDPEGGLYGRDSQGHLNGYLEEITFMRGPGERVMDLSGVDDYAVEAQQIYASYGITTAQEGFAHKTDVETYTRLGQGNKLLLDMVAYVDIIKESETVQSRTDLKEYCNHFRIGGYKIFLDGSPQGKTAWLSRPYENSGDYCGYATYSDQDVDKYIQQALDENRQLLCHCNGDAASQQMLNAFKHSRQKTTDTRPVMVHAQTLRPDQLPQLEETGIMPSYFVAHVYYWGDVHIKNLGVERAGKISCTGSALKEGICFTFHQDTPVINPDMLETVSIAVNRMTKEGVLLGADERISVMEALKAVTINAAYQYFEEEKKGSIKEGKLADLVILQQNPLKVDKKDIGKIQILETIKEGKTIYQK